MFGKSVPAVLYVLLIYLSIGYCNAETFRIGGIFENKDGVKKLINAFNAAVNDVNESEDYDFQFEAVIQVIRDNPYEAMIKTCSLLEDNVIGIFGPMVEDNSNMVQSICDVKEIPQIEVRWDDYPLNGTIVSLYPYPDELTKTYLDIIETWGWRDFVILYENDESLQRVGELLKNFVPNTHRMVIRQLKDDYRTVLKELWRSGATHFVLDASIDTMPEVLRQAQQVGLMTNKQHYIITNLDLHTIDLVPYQYSETNITGMRFIDPEDERLQRVAGQIYRGQEESYVAGWKLRIEEALLYDAVMMFAETIKVTGPIKEPANINCYDSNEIFSSGTSIINFMKNLEYPGLTGRVKFGLTGFRTNFGLEITELKEGGVIKIGSWNSTESRPLNITRLQPKGPEDLDDIRNRTFIVITTLTEPYGMEKISSESLQGNDRYEGFAIDLIHELSIMRGFNYTIIIREDKKNGQFDNATQRWTGMIGDLIERRADLAITDLTITLEREGAVDFTSPFMMLGIGILYTKPTKAPPSFFSFADPFAFEVWRLLMVACVGVPFVLFILGRISPTEWENPYPCIEEPEYLVNQLDLRNCAWFVTGSIMQQGSEIELKSVATRMVAGMWWFFTLLMVSSYTANLAAFLTTENPDPHFSNLKELIEVAEEKNIKYGAKLGGATANFFRDKAATGDAIYAKAWQFMKDNEDDVMVHENKDGVDRAEKGEYAFFMESSSIEYEIQRRCSLNQVNGLLDEKGYGIAMRKNEPYRNSLSTGILMLQSSGKLDDIKRKWWQERRGGGRCVDEASEAEATPLNLKNVGGVFWVTVGGTILAFFMAILETLSYAYKKSVRTKTPFKAVLLEEIKFYFRFHEMVKPVTQGSSSEGSGSNQYRSEEKELPYNYVNKDISINTLDLDSYTNSNKSKKNLKCIVISFFEGALFEENELHEKAFHYAINTVNTKIQEDDFTLTALVNNEVQEDEPFLATRQVCSLLNLGVVAVFGPRSSSNIEAVQSVCDYKEIPHIITNWNYFPLRDSTEINFYPHPPMLSDAYFDIVSALEWKTFTVLYESEDGFLRVASLIQKAKDAGTLVSIQHLDQYHSGNYRTALKEVKATGQTYFVVDCEIEHLEDVLLQFQQVGLMTDEYHYFITNLDAHTEDLTPFQYSDTNITGVEDEKRHLLNIVNPFLFQIRLLNPDKTIVQTVSAGFYANDLNVLPPEAAWKIKTETALIIDAVNMFSSILNDIKRQSSIPIITNNNILQCNASDSWQHGYSVVNMLQTHSYMGLTGLIRFNTSFRDAFELNIYELKEGGVTSIGVWNTSTGLSIARMSSEPPVPDADSLQNKTFVVITTLTEPYGMLKETHETLTGNDRFEGFGIDLIQKLSEMEGFNYTFILREDKQNGAKDSVTQRWSGMIGDLLEHRADLAITDFTITSEREEAVDFTVPFMNLGISILFRKPFTAPPSFFSFADPFALETWVALALAFFVVAISLFIMGRLCPDEWTNPYPCIEEPEYLINQFSMSNSIWFATGSLMCQGSEIAPIAISTRMVAGMWWFFCLLIVASYTANLAAFLATENPVELFKDIHTLYENAPVHKIKFGAKKNGATEKFFTNAEDGIFQKIGQYMKEHPEDAVNENNEGVVRAEEHLYAFFMESTSIEYNTQRHCDLQQYGGLLDDKGYGIAMRKESPYRKRLSTAILKLQASGTIDELKRKWWEERRGGGQCSGEAEAAEATPLGLKNVEGCFWVTIYGTILAGIFVIIEHMLYVLKVSKKAKISFLDAFKEEFKFYLDFNSNVKPVLSKSSLDKSESEDVEKSPKTKSRSRSKSKSKSPSRSKTKSKSSKESQNTKANGSLNSRLPYGFIFSPSMERLDETT
ncbi:hypothetical protein NQ315_008455 [Exocentrus adspersus]|uniref:Uncharacterized protein n=1 Tax=Exocentrus adspersus TaxID=1586481 RepID=A0AAV8W5U4_9CUCU|nr:hypothetical protein NQ315_008455 [Exocentrus adspersus]